MALKRLLGLGSKRLRAVTILGAAGKAILGGNVVRGIGLVVVAALAWKYFVVAMAAELLLSAIRKGDEETTETDGTDDVGTTELSV